MSDINSTIPQALSDIKWHDYDKEIPPETGEYLVIYSTTPQALFSMNTIGIGMKIDHFVNETSDKVLYNKQFVLTVNDCSCTILMWAEVPTIPFDVFKKIDSLYDIKDKKFLFI